MTRSKRRIYCWIRQQRALLAVHKFIYYELSESIYEDLQFDYLEARLEVLEKRYPDIAKAVTEEGYLSPGSYVDSLKDPTIEKKAMLLFDDWIARGRLRISNVPFMNEHIDTGKLCWDALRAIVKYPI